MAAGCPESPNGRTPWEAAEEISSFCAFKRSAVFAKSRAQSNQRPLSVPRHCSAIGRPLKSAAQRFGDPTACLFGYRLPPLRARGFRAASSRKHNTPTWMPIIRWNDSRLRRWVFREQTPFRMTSWTPKRVSGPETNCRLTWFDGVCRRPGRRFLGPASVTPSLGGRSHDLQASLMSFKNMERES
jgi:hypothetical protein